MSARDPEAVAAAVRETGPPDELTLTAGVGHAGFLLDATTEDWDRGVGL